MCHRNEFRATATNVTVSKNQETPVRADEQRQSQNRPLTHTSAAASQIRRLAADERGVRPTAARQDCGPAQTTRRSRAIRPAKRAMERKRLADRPALREPS